MVCTFRAFSSLTESATAAAVSSTSRNERPSVASGRVTFLVSGLPTPTTPTFTLRILPPTFKLPGA